MKTIALTWGWTWWHVFPLLALYNYLKDDDNLKFIWVWELDSLEEEEAEKAWIPFFDISAWKIRRYFDVRNLYEPLKNTSWVFQWIQILKKQNVDIVFSKWGYVSLPLCLAARVLSKKIYIHESDMISWATNNLIWNMATKIFYTYPNEKIDSKKHILTWQILNPELLDWITNIKIDQNEFLNVLVIAWSQWSTRIFNSLLKVIPNFQDVKFYIILGVRNLHFRDRFKDYLNVSVYDFVSPNRLWKIYKTTDIAITRASSSLWELYNFWIHSIIIPLEESANNHQTANANYFKEKYWSDLILESENIEENLIKLLQKYKDLRKVWLNLKNFLEPLKKIKEEMLEDNSK